MNDKTSRLVEILKEAACCADNAASALEASDQMVEYWYGEQERLASERAALVRAVRWLVGKTGLPLFETLHGLPMDVPPDVTAALEIVEAAEKSTPGDQSKTDKPWPGYPCRAGKTWFEEAIEEAGKVKWSSHHDSSGNPCAVARTKDAEVRVYESGYVVANGGSTPDAAKSRAILVLAAFSDKVTP